MPGYLAIILHAHLPFVRHPEHEKFLEESWLFEAITETYLPLLQIMDGWQRDGMEARLTLTLSPTLCAMLRDPLLQDRYARHLDSLIELAEKEIHRTHWDRAFQELAWHVSPPVHRRARHLPRQRRRSGRRVPPASRTSASWRSSPPPPRTRCCRCWPIIRRPSARRSSSPAIITANVSAAIRAASGCRNAPTSRAWKPFLQEANLRWFIAGYARRCCTRNPRPRYGVFAPVFTPNGIAAFGRDLESSRQVWSRTRVIPATRATAISTATSGSISISITSSRICPRRTIAGSPASSITASPAATAEKQIYERRAALQAADDHAGHFLEARAWSRSSNSPASWTARRSCVAPYDAELFGHWWYEGPEFLDYFVRKAYYDQKVFELITPEQYLRRHPTNQIATPSASSWGEEGYWRVWLNEKNEWIYPHLQVAQERMTELAQQFPKPDAADRLARSNRPAANCCSRRPATGRSSSAPTPAPTTPANASKTISALSPRFTTSSRPGKLDEKWLAEIESRDNLSRKST